MRKATVAKRLAVLKGVAVAGVFATAAIAAGSASAQVFVLPVGANGITNGANLTTDINTANSNGGSNTIVIDGPGVYEPASTLTITDPNLTITSNHAQQLVNGGAPIIDGAQDTADAPLVSISSGGGLTVQGVDFRAIGVANGSFPGIDVSGSLTSYSSAFQANPTEATIQVETGGTASLSETLVSDNLGDGIDNEGGTINLNLDTIIRNVFGLVLNGGTTNATNSILALNGGSAGTDTNCTGATLNSSSYDVDTDGTCVAPGDTTSKTGVTQAFGQTKSNGGPTPTAAITTGPAVGEVPAANCQLTDQRFFLIPSGTNCDAGSYQHNATQDTTPPSCPGPGVITPNVSQMITLSDPLSGLGPEGGTITDQSDAQAGVTLGNDQADVVDGVAITNGTVAATGFSASGPSTSPIQVTATKTTSGTPTRWSFYATNWAGLTKFCS